MPEMPEKPNIVSRITHLTLLNALWNNYCSLQVQATKNADAVDEVVATSATSPAEVPIVATSASSPSEVPVVATSATSPSEVELDLDDLFN